MATHGHSFVGGKPTLTYTSWQRMHQRCRNPNCPDYPYYGGRGITICERWMEFENFLADMGERPSKALTLDRINNRGNYEPTNCRWASKKEQANNRDVKLKSHCKNGHPRKFITKLGPHIQWCRECARLREARKRLKQIHEREELKLLQSVAGTPSGAVLTCRLPLGPAGSFLEQVLGSVEVVDERLPHGGSL